MKKKLAVMVIVLSAFCFTGFAQEVFNSTSSQYVAKGEKKREYTLIVTGEVKIGGEWTRKKERFVIIAKSHTEAEGIAKKKFDEMYGSYYTRNVTFICESTKDRCDYEF